MLYSKLTYLFLTLELYEQINDLAEKLSFDLDLEFADQPVLIRIFNEFRMYLFTSCKTNSKNFRPDSPEAFEQYYIYRKNYVMANHNTRFGCYYLLFIAITHLVC